MLILDLLWEIDWKRVLRALRKRPGIVLVMSAILPGIFAAVLEFLITGGLSGIVPIVSAVAGGVLAAVLLYVFNQISPVIDSQTLGIAASRDSERFFSPRTPAELVSELEGQTTMVAERISERHLGHWLKVSGAIANVRSVYGSVIVYIPPNDSQPFLDLQFDGKSWQSRLSALNIGDHVVVEGKISDIDSHSVSLKECRLV